MQKHDDWKGPQMTPLEELQAARKRLSELRQMAMPGPWERPANDLGEHPDASIDGRGGYAVASTTLDSSADLIVTLHRTIDAQLAILSEAEMNEIGKGRMRPLTADAKVRFGLMLARAINGEAS